MNDPVNPAHYAGRACADIGERLTANAYQVLKYVWRLGRKDAEDVELGKAVWYANSECELFARLWAVGINMRSAPLVLDLPDPEAFFVARIEGQPEFTQRIARLLWRGYNASEIVAIHGVLEAERNTYASS